MTTREQAIEAAAKAIRAAVVSEGDIPESTTTWRDYRPDATAALAAVVPVLLNDLADRIEAQRDDELHTPNWNDALAVAAGDVRAAAEGWGE